jgi:hypothetical protein
MAKPYESRLIPFGDTVLIRVPESTGGTILTVVKDEEGKTQTVRGKPAPTCRGVVVSVGPGEWESGVFVKPDERLRAGCTVLFDPGAKLQFGTIPEFKEEQLWFLSAKAVLFIEQPK